MKTELRTSAFHHSTNLMLSGIFRSVDSVSPPSPKNFFFYGKNKHIRINKITVYVNCKSKVRIVFIEDLKFVLQNPQTHRQTLENLKESQDEIESLKEQCKRLFC